MRRKFNLNKLQTEAILSMRLGSLRKLDELSTKREIADLGDELNFLNKLIKNKIFLNKYIINELVKTNNEIDKTKLSRRTKVNSEQISDVIRGLVDG